MLWLSYAGTKPSSMTSTYTIKVSGICKVPGNYVDDEHWRDLEPEEDRMVDILERMSDSMGIMWICVKRIFPTPQLLVVAMWTDRTDGAQMLCHSHSHSHRQKGASRTNSEWHQNFSSRSFKSCKSFLKYVLQKVLQVQRQSFQEGGEHPQLQHHCTPQQLLNALQRFGEVHWRIVGRSLPTPHCALHQQMQERCHQHL